MNLEQLKEILEHTRRQSPELSSLADAFDGFLELYLIRNQEHRDQKKFQEHLRDSFRILWDTFDRVAASKGLNANEMSQHLANPSNFTPEQWQEIQTVKEDFQHLEIPKGSKRHNKQKKNVRI